MLLSALFSGLFMASNVTHHKKKKKQNQNLSVFSLFNLFTRQIYTLKQRCEGKVDKHQTNWVVSRSPDVPTFVSPSPGYTSGTAGWRRFTQWSSSTVSSPAHRSLSRCPQGRTSSGTVWLWSPSAPPNTSASLTWSLVRHKSSLERFRHGRANQIVLQMRW